MDRHLIFVLLMGGQASAPAFIFPTPTHYVRKTGNDTTGNGSFANPWLTLNKAETTLSASGGPFIIAIGDGTYAETSFSSNHWNVNTNTSANVRTYQTENGLFGDVTITAATGGTAQPQTVFINKSNYTFNYLKFVGMSTDSIATIRTYTGNNLTFNHCTVTQTATAGAKAITIDQPAAASGLIFSYCTFTALSTAVYIAPTNTTTGITFTNCTMTSTNAAGMYAAAAGSGIIAGLVLTDCVLTGKDSTIFSVGVDGSTGRPVTCTATRVTVINTGTTGHNILFGAGNTDSSLNGCVATQCTDYALVLKAHGSAGHGTVVQNCTFSAPTSDIYTKGAAYPNIHNNTLQGVGGFGNLQVGPQVAIPCDHITFTNNTINPSGVGYIFKWPSGVANDLGGGVCDYNSYYPSANKYGTVQGDTDVQTLAELRTAWSTYDVTTNDANSTEA